MFFMNFFDSRRVFLFTKPQSWQAKILTQTFANHGNSPFKEAELCGAVSPSFSES
jgi:hypothetical protein